MLYGWESWRDSLADSAELLRLHIFLVIKIALKHATMAETGERENGKIGPDRDRSGKRKSQAKPSQTLPLRQQQQKLVNVCACLTLSLTRYPYSLSRFGSSSVTMCLV